MIIHEDSKSMYDEFCAKVRVGRCSEINPTLSLTSQ